MVAIPTQRRKATVGYRHPNMIADVLRGRRHPHSQFGNPTALVSIIFAA